MGVLYHMYMSVTQQEGVLYITCMCHLYHLHDMHVSVSYTSHACVSNIRRVSIHDMHMLVTSDADVINITS